MYPLSTRDKYCGFRIFSFFNPDLTAQSASVSTLYEYLLRIPHFFNISIIDLSPRCKWLIPQTSWPWSASLNLRIYRRSGNRHRRVWRWAGTKTHQSDSGLPQASDIQPHNSRWAQFPLDKFPITNFRVRTAVWTRRDKCTEIPCFQGFYGTRV